MPKTKQTPEIAPISFLTVARQFYAASELVFEPQDWLLSKPLYFLYFHSLELTFKAFLRSHNVPIGDLKDKKGHELVALYKDCLSHGFAIGPSHQVDMERVVKLLEKANEFQGIRYFNPNLKMLPSLSRTNKVAQRAIQAVESPAPRRYLKPTNKSWRVDETYVRVKGRWCYLYRAIDSAGATIDFLLSALPDASAAKQLFRKALSSLSHPMSVSLASASAAVFLLVALQC